MGLFAVPWGHIRLLIEKCKGDGDKVLFYARKTVENNWSRAVLLNFLDTNLYERQGKAVTNFADTLPAPQGDLAQEITKDPNNFDFLAMRERYDERELVPHVRQVRRAHDAVGALFLRADGRHGVAEVMQITRSGCQWGGPAAATTTRSPNRSSPR